MFGLVARGELWVDQVDSGFEVHARVRPRDALFIALVLQFLVMFGTSPIRPFPLRFVLGFAGFPAVAWFWVQAWWEWKSFVHATNVDIADSFARVPPRHPSNGGGRLTSACN